MNTPIRAVQLLSVVSALAVAAGGCVKTKVAVCVNPDGSGHLVVGRLFDAATVQAIEMQRSQSVTDDFEMEMPSMPNIPDGPGADKIRAMVEAQMSKVKAQMEEMKAHRNADPFFDEKMFKKEAKSYGAGVKFVKARRLDVQGGRGSIAVYSFKDINDVFIVPDVGRFQGALYGGGMDPFASGDDGEENEAGSRRGKGGIEFSFQTGAVSRLKILLPVPEDGDDAAEGDVAVNGNEEGEGGEGDEGFPGGMDPEEFAEWQMGGFNGGPFPMDMAGMEMMYNGFCDRGDRSGPVAILCDVVFNGKIVSSSASHTNAANRNRVVLLDFDSTRRDKKDAKKTRDNDSYDYYDFGRLMRGIAKRPGTVVETNREVVVEFK